jgi:putative ABC transport system ATP-binding protein
MLLQAIGLKKSYSNGEVTVDAVRGIDLAVEQGEFLAIVGRSGSGKSTLLSMLGAIETPTAGQVILEGTDLASLDDDRRTLLRRRRIGFVFQAFNLIPTLTTLENVALPLELDGVSERAARARARASLESVDLLPRAGHLPGMLSGGEQQRVALARALVIQPALVLADEPTGNLDTQSGERVVGLLRELVDDRKQTVVMVTHDMQVATQADRIIRVCDGLIVNEEHSPAYGTGQNLEAGLVGSL